MNQSTSGCLGKDSQEKKILSHLKSGKSLTPLEALEKFGCFRLSARIMDLRRKDYHIDTVMVTKGEKRFAKYVLKNKAS